MVPTYEAHSTIAESNQDRPRLEEASETNGFGQVPTIRPRFGLTSRAVPFQYQ